MNITVVGLGKIGLPLAVQYAASGHQVRGADVNPQTVETVNAGPARPSICRTKRDAEAMSCVCS